MTKDLVNELNLFPVPTIRLAPPGEIDDLDYVKEFGRPGDLWNGDVWSADLTPDAINNADFGLDIK